jgi:ABC-type oligopeptide transport system substrate-binding subunit
MRVRLWVSLGALALGVGLLLTAQLAGASRGFRQGGIFRYGTTGASVQVDPQIAYITTAWWLEYATAAKLFNYPEREGAAGWRLAPEVASKFTVSGDGRTYSFVIRKGFRFSDGSPVTARSFAYAIDRVANKQLASPGAAFITDPNGTNIVGAKAVNDGMSTHVRGVVTKGNRLTIRLTGRDDTLLTKLAMPFFQATSTTLPLTREVTTGYPSAGPYFFSKNEVDAVTQLRRNPHYGGARPRNLDGAEVRWNLSEQSAFEQVLANELDEAPIPAAETQGVADRFGVNRTRFWAKATSCLGMIRFNNERPLFKNNATLRRAVNWAVDRRGFVGTLPPYAGTPWTHLLPPGFPGSITAKKLQPYATTPRLGKARRLAAGHLRGGKITIAYRTSESGPAQMELVRRDLIRLGFKPDGITLKGFSGGDIYEAMGKRNSGLDLGVSMGWCTQFDGDPAATLDLFASDSEKYQRRLEAAKRLRGNARLRALGRLDIALMKNVAPVAVMRTYNNLYFFSARVDPKSLVYKGVYSDWSIPALALK